MKKGILEPYIEFDGNAKEAFELYQSIFKTDPPYMMLFKDLPPDDAMEMGDFDTEGVMHASLNLGDAYLMGSDTVDDYSPPQGIYISWASENSEDVEEVWKGFVNAGSEIIMDLDKTFRSEKYGILKDPYNVKWMIQVHEKQN